MAGSPRQMQIIRVCQENDPTYEWRVRAILDHSAGWVIICQAVTLFYINLSRNFFWSALRPQRERQGRWRWECPSACHTPTRDWISGKISNIIWQHKLLQHPAPLPPPPPPQQRAQCVQNSNSDDEGAQERPGGGRHVKGWLVTLLGCDVSGENILAGDLFNYNIFIVRHRDNNLITCIIITNQQHSSRYNPRKNWFWTNPKPF